MENPEGETRHELTPEEQEEENRKEQALRLGLGPHASAKEIAKVGPELAEKNAHLLEKDLPLDGFEENEITELNRKAPTGERLSKREILLARAIIKNDINVASDRANEILKGRNIEPGQRRAIVSDLNKKLQEIWDIIKDVVLPEHADQQIAIRLSIRDSAEALKAFDKRLGELENLPSIADTEKKGLADARQELEASSSDEEFYRENQRLVEERRAKAKAEEEARLKQAEADKNMGVLGRLLKRALHK